jgi:curved DNA-binding protein CbpA
MEKVPDYYEVIQVDPRAERDVIDVAYRRLASKYHPDVNPSSGATDRMKLINAAYEILSNPAKRAEYDSRRRGEPRMEPRPSPKPSSQKQNTDWLTSAVVTGLMLALTSLGPRFGLRSILIVGMLFLLGWLIMTWRKR